MLFEMAAMVRDAVTSVMSVQFQQELICSTVVETKLLLGITVIVAYSLRPKIATQKDFDKCIDGVTGAEKSRDVNIFSQNNRKHSNPSRQNQYNGPTMLNTNMDEDPKGKEDACLVCNANPRHRLEACLKFRFKTPTDQARDCAKFYHFFCCLGRDHFSRSYKKNTACVTEGCRNNITRCCTEVI